MVKRTDWSEPEGAMKRGVRVSLLLTRQELDEMHRHVATTGETLSEYWRRALRLQRYFDKLREEGEGIYVKDKDGTYQRVIIL